MKTTKDYSEIIRDETANNPELAAEFDQFEFSARIASLILEAREDAGLTQRELADLINSKQSVIARLEDWDYSGHSLTLLKRIADALKLELHLELRKKQNNATHQAVSTSIIEWQRYPAFWPTESRVLETYPMAPTCIAGV